MREGPLRQQIGNNFFIHDLAKPLNYSDGLNHTFFIAALAQQGVQEIEAYKAQLSAQGKGLTKGSLFCNSQLFLKRCSFYSRGRTQAPIGAFE